jgi:predicted ATPase/DNA-binding winged helix-turn-helix (wHTH) protein
VPSRSTGISEKVLTFGPFQLFRSERILRQGAKTVRLGDRALDILIALVERAGEIVSKNELLHYAWPDTVVEENNLRVHIAAIRKILGDGHGGERYILNVARRGYRFVAPVGRIDLSAPDSEPGTPDATSGSMLPAPLTRIVGREEAIRALAAQVPRRRLVTIVGPGGVGKTTVAIAVAEQVAGFFQRVCFVDLSAVEDPAQVHSVLETVIGFSALKDDPIGSLIAYLLEASILIVLDNCEHVIAHAAELVERILRATSRVSILATSREPLLAEGEYVYNLEPLLSPSDSTRLLAESALSFSAVQLFVERAMNGLEGFDLTDANVNAVAAICRRLDGIPLAIELVAARVGLLGMHALGNDLGDALILTTKGRRTAGSRHQSLRATLDWSYRTLDQGEQILFRRLSVFKASFSVESAAALAAGGGGETVNVLDALMSLVGKSLLTADLGGQSIRYRLLQTTRAYASERLEESGERPEMLRLHAEHVHALLEGAVSHWEKITRPEWLARYGSLLDDVRAALEWAFAPGGNLELGTALTVASLPYGFQFSLIDESKQRATLALEALSRRSPPRPLWEIRINNSLGSLLYHTGAPQAAVMRIIHRAHVLAQQTSVPPQDSIEPLISLATLSSMYGDVSAALAATAELEALARRMDDSIAILIADRVGAQIYHFAGDHAKARLLAERVLRYPSRTIPLAYGQTPVDRQVSMRVVLSRILWMEGRPDEADRVAAEATRLAASDGPTAMCQVLGFAACPIAFWRGDLVAAEKLTKMLADYSRRFNFDRWTTLSDCYELALRLLSGRVAGEGPGPHASAGRVPEGALYRDMLCTIHPVWLDGVTLERARSLLSGWANPEILRVAAAQRLHDPSADEAAAESDLRTALQIARDQNALSWELRATTSLAVLLQRRGRSSEALNAMHTIYAKLTEGLETTDLIAAKALIEELQIRGYR